MLGYDITLRSKNKQIDGWMDGWIESEKERVKDRER